MVDVSLPALPAISTTRMRLLNGQALGDIVVAEVLYEFYDINQCNIAEMCSTFDATDLSLIDEFFHFPMNQNDFKLQESHIMLQDFLNILIHQILNNGEVFGS